MFRKYLSIYLSIYLSFFLSFFLSIIWCVDHALSVGITASLSQNPSRSSENSAVQSTAPSASEVLSKRMTGFFQEYPFTNIQVSNCHYLSIAFQGIILQPHSIISMSLCHKNAACFYLLPSFLQIQKEGSTGTVQTEVKKLLGSRRNHLGNQREINGKP